MLRPSAPPSTPSTGRCGRCGRSAAARSLTIAALPCIAQLWLAPRLPDLQAAFDLDVTILTRDEQPDYARDLVDLGLYVGDAAPAGAPPWCSPATTCFRSARRPWRRACATRSDLAGRRCCTIRSGARTGRAGSPPMAQGHCGRPGRRRSRSTASPSTRRSPAAGSSSATGPRRRRAGRGRLVAPFGDRAVAGPPLRLIVPEGGEGMRLAPVIRWLSEGGEPGRRDGPAVT